MIKNHFRLHASTPDTLVMHGVITAANVNTTTRTLTGMVVPFNIIGRTSAGAVQVKAGTLTIPHDITRIKLLAGHSIPGREPNPVGVAQKIWETNEGIFAAFKIASTPAGDIALVEAAEGIRTGLSVELSHVHISGNTIISGTLEAVAHVTTPAFDRSHITEIAANHHQQKETLMTPEQRARLAALRAKADRTAAEETELIGLAALEASTPADAAPAAADQSAAPAAAPAAADQSAAPAAAPAAADQSAAPAAALAASAHAPIGFTGGSPATGTLTAAEAIAAIVTAAQTGDAGELHAALAAIGGTANEIVEAPGWLGELWTANGYTRKFVPLLTPVPLTHRRMFGWRYVTTPEVDDYAGDLADIPSNEFETEEVAIQLHRIAGGHRFDRVFIDFPDAEYLLAYWRRMMNSYARKTDEHAQAAILNWADLDNPITTAPATNILDAAAAAVGYLDTEFETAATFVMVNPADKRNILSIAAQDAPAFLKDILNISPDAFVSNKNVPAGKLVAGAKAGGSFYEYGGGVPVRVEAAALAQGGFDRAMHGYWSTLDNDRRVFVTAEF